MKRYFINYPRQPSNKGHPNYTGCRGQPAIRRRELTHNNLSKTPKGFPRNRGDPPDDDKEGLP